MARTLQYISGYRHYTGANLRNMSPPLVLERYSAGILSTPQQKQTLLGVFASQVDAFLFEELRF